MFLIKDQLSTLKSATVFIILYLLKILYIFIISF